jgi:rod shape determining protein RodA
MRRFLSFHDFDWMLLAFVVALSVISVLEIYSATLHTQFRHFDEKQVLWLAAGFFCMFVLSLIDYHILLDIAVWAYGICLLFLVAVLAIGQKVLGARRWIRLPGGLHFQPSEWVKLVLIIMLARFFSTLSGRDLTWRDILKAMVLIGIPMLLVLKQPDLGTALTYAPVLLVGLFLGGIRFRQAAILCLAAGLAIVPAWYKVLKPYQKQRLTSFITPDNDPRGSG